MNMPCPMLDTIDEKRLSRSGTYGGSTRPSLGDVESMIASEVGFLRSSTSLSSLRFSGLHFASGVVVSASGLVGSG